uniref:Uncharacterized protein n=1 Tax=Romanomermis culicivorax TaxID=13658 RepID=A0A915JMZ9_ROMCU
MHMHINHNEPKKWKNTSAALLSVATLVTRPWCQITTLVFTPKIQHPLSEHLLDVLQQREC